MKIRKILLTVVTIGALTVAAVLTAVSSFATGQLRALNDQAAYSTPEDGMREQVAHSYSGVSKVEIVHAGKEFFGGLWFVEARVWAASRCDGNGFRGRGYDNPGSFYLSLPEGWALVPEGKSPMAIALGKWLLDFQT